MDNSNKPCAHVNQNEGQNDLQPDTRRQLYNHCEIGPINRIQLPVDMITRLRGIMLDLDPCLFSPSVLSTTDSCNAPLNFYESIVHPWLKRHPVLRDAEVLNTGRGLHVNIWLQSPVEFATDADRQRWSGIVKAVQTVLPTDPDAPGIAATTRVAGSVNSKNGACVELLAAGKPVETERVLELYEKLKQQPFRTIASILFGHEKIEPCPICAGGNTSLSALDHIGHCYGSCGKVQLSALYDVFLEPRPITKPGK